MPISCGGCCRRKEVRRKGSWYMMVVLKGSFELLVLVYIQGKCMENRGKCHLHCLNFRYIGSVSLKAHQSWDFGLSPSCARYCCYRTVSGFFFYRWEGWYITSVILNIISTWLCGVVNNVLLINSSTACPPSKKKKILEEFFKIPLQSLHFCIMNSVR